MASREARSRGASFTRARVALAAVLATLALCLAARSIWVNEIGPYDWPESMPEESNRVYSPGGFSMIVPKGWRSGAGTTHISAISGASNDWSTQIWIQKGISESSQPRPLLENAQFQGTAAYQTQGITYREHGAREFFECRIFVKRHGVPFEIRVRTWRRPVPDTLPECLQRYIETFAYSPSGIGKERE